MAVDALLAQIDKPFSNKPKCVVVTTKARKLYYYCDDDEATQSWCDVMALAADRAGRQRKLEDEMRSEGLRGLAEVVAKKDELAAANDDLAEELTLVQTELSAAREELAQAHQAQMDLCSKHQAELEGLVERHSTELAALRKERDEAVAAAGATVLLQGRHEEASKALSVALAGRDEHVRRHESLRTEHESLADENAHLIARNSELALQVAQLQAAMEKAADINTCASECGPKPDDSTAAYGAEAGATPDGARDLHEPTIAGAACDDSTDWHSKYLELQHELNAMRLQGSAGLDSLVDSESAVASVVAEHDALTAAHDALKGDHSALLEKYGSLSGDLEALRVKHEELLASVDPSHDDSEAAVASLVAERDALAAERDALKGDHSLLLEKYGSICGDLEALRVEYEELLASVDPSNHESEAAVAALVAERDTVVAERDALKGGHNALAEAHNDVHGDLEALRVKHEELMASVDSSRVDSEAAVASLVAERDALAAEHDALKGDHSALREQHESVTSDLEALRVKHEDMLLSAGPSPVTPTRIAVDRCVGSAAVPVAADTGDEASGLDTVRVGGAVRRPACAYCVIQQDATRGGARGAGNARMQLLAVARPPSDQPVEVPSEEDGGGTEGAHRPLVVPEGLGLDEVHIDADTHRAALADGMSVSSSSDDDDAAVGLAAGASATTPATRQAPSAVAALRRSILARISTPAPRGTAGASGFVTPVRGASMPGRGPPAAHAAAGGVESPITGASAAGRWLSAAHARSLSSHANEGTAPALSFRRASQHSTERASPASMVAAGKWVEILPDDGSQFSLSRDEDAIEALWGSKKVCAAVLLRVLFNAGILWVVGDGMSCVAGPAAVVHLDARRGRPQLRVHVAKARHGWRYHGPSPPPH